MSRANAAVVRRGVPFLLACALSLGPAAARARPVGDGELVFGMCGPFSGQVKDLGRQMRVGIEAAFTAQNAAGGVQGRKLSLVAADDGYDSERTRGAMRKLLDKHDVFALVGNVGTAGAAVAAPLAMDRGKIFFGALTGADLLRNDPPDRFVFNYRASHVEETATAVKYLVEVRRIRPSQIAVFAQEDAYGDSGFEGVAYMMHKYRVDPSSILRVGYKRGSTDVAEAVRAIKRHVPRVRGVVMVPTYRAASRFIQRAKDENLELVFAAISSVGSMELAENLMQLGPRYAEGLIVTQVVPVPTSRASAMLKYQQDLARYAPEERPNFVSLEGYIVANLLIEGLQRAGKNLTTDALIDALEGIKGLDLGIGTPLGFGPSEHQASHRVWLTVLDGQGAFRIIRGQ